MIYFDNAATTYPKPNEVYSAINEGMHRYAFNSGRGSYKLSRDTYSMIQKTREKIANIVDAEKDDVVFTASATESLNIIISGLNLKETDNVYISPFEHNSVIRALKLSKATVIVIPFVGWCIDMNKLNDLFVMKKPKAVIVSHISNVTGFELPYEKIFALSKRFDSINILDSAQGFGIYPIHSNDVDMLIFAGHKSLYAMMGIAGFVNKGKVKMSIYKAGGTGSDSMNQFMPEDSPTRYEAGSLNSVGIYSISQSIDYLKTVDFKEIKHNLTSYFIEKAKKHSYIKLYLPENYIPKGIVSFNVMGFNSDDIGNVLASDYDICVRTGYHCAPIVHELLDTIDFGGTIRVSFSGYNTTEEIDLFFNALQEIVGE